MAITSRTMYLDTSAVTPPSGTSPLKTSTGLQTSTVLFTQG
jgi:hypothetical protein